jgi:hypothetical protein
MRSDAPLDRSLDILKLAERIERQTAEHVAGADAFVVPTLVNYDALHRNGRELGFSEVSMAKLARYARPGSARSKSCSWPASRSVTAPIS